MRGKSLKTLLLVVGLALAITGSAGLIVATSSDDKAKPAASSQAPAEKKQPANYIKYQGEDGKTALELLKEASTTVVTKDSSYGPYVDSIGDLTGGTEGKYWSFYVNGTLASVGADAYQTKSTDTIEWKFEKL